MKYITGNNRHQMQFFSLEEYIHQDNEVRLIDLFVDSLNLQEFGFDLDFSHNGRPPYHPKDLLKLYLYGYLKCRIHFLCLQSQANIQFDR